MQEKIITLASPVFFLLIFIELIVGLLRRRNTRCRGDTTGCRLRYWASALSPSAAACGTAILPDAIYCRAVDHDALSRCPHHNTMPLLHSLSYAAWLAGGLWIIGGLMERRTNYMVLEVMRLVASTAGITLIGAWFGGFAFPLAVRGGIIAFFIGSLVLLWIVFKQSATTHGYFSHQ